VAKAPVKSAVVLNKDGTPKPYKLPTPGKKAIAFGPIVDDYKEWAEARLAEGKKAEAFATQEKAIKAFLLDNLSKGKDGGAVGDRYKAIVKLEDTFQVEDWDKVWAYIKKNGAFELLARALNMAAVAEHTDRLNEKLDIANAKIDDPKKRKPRKMLPGIKVFTISKLSVTKK